MADSPLAKRPDDDAGERHSVLADLPNARPQRTSRRREAARTRAGAPAGKPTATQKPGRSKTAAKAAKPGAEKQTKAVRKAPAKIANTTARPRLEPKPKAGATKQATGTPRQGYEADSELLGTPVSPPTGTELAGALAELAGELAHTGISAGGRLLKGALSRLSG